MPQKVLLSFLSLFFVWVMITGFNAEEIVLGTVVSALIAFISSREFIKGSVAAKFHPRRWVFSLIYVMIFLAVEVYSHINLILRIIFGKVDSGIFMMESKFKSPGALTVLGNSITLTPGTLTLDVKGNKIVTYCLNEKSEMTTKIFEAFLESVYR